MKSRIFPGLFIIFSVFFFSCTVRLDFEQRRFSNRFYSRVQSMVETDIKRLQEDCSISPASDVVASGLSELEPGLTTPLNVSASTLPVRVIQDPDTTKKKKGKREDNFRFDPERSSPDMDKKDSKLAIFSLIAGVLSFASMFILFYGVLLFGLTSLVLVYLARRKMKMKPETTGGYGLTVAALLLVAVAFLISGWLVISFFSN